MARAPTYRKEECWFHWLSPGSSVQLDSYPTGLNLAGILSNLGQTGQMLPLSGSPLVFSRLPSVRWVCSCPVPGLAWLPVSWEIPPCPLPSSLWGTTHHCPVIPGYLSLWTRWGLSFAQQMLVSRGLMRVQLAGSPALQVALLVQKYSLCFWRCWTGLLSASLFKQPGLLLGPISTSSSGHVLSIPSVCVLLQFSPGPFLWFTGEALLTQTLPGKFLASAAGSSVI